MPNPLNSLALPATQFIPGSSLATFFPFTIANNTTTTLPSNTPRVLDLSGFNTLSIVITFSAIGAGNTFTAVLVTFDPETGAAVVSSLGNATLISKTVNGTYAATLYLPSYYSTLVGLILPFYQMKLNLAHTGGTAGNLSVDALKIWLHNA